MSGSFKEASWHCLWSYNTFSHQVLSSSMGWIYNKRTWGANWCFFASYVSLRTLLEVLYCTWSNSSDFELFKSISRNSHCLNQLLQHKIAGSYNLRSRGHNYELPLCTTTYFKQSCINRLILYLTCFCVCYCTLYFLYILCVCHWIIKGLLTYLLTSTNIMWCEVIPF